MSAIQQVLAGLGYVPSYTAYTAIFDGTNDYISIASTPTGLTDSGAGTISFWLKAGADGVLYRIQATNSNRFNIERTAANLIRLVGITSGSVTVLDISTTSTITTSSGWKHIYICFDLNQAQANTKIYINGVSDTLTYTTFTPAGTVDKANTLFRLGGSSSATNRLNGSLAEYWLYNTYFDDPTKFYSGGHPISLGAGGELPTGTEPVLYLSKTGSGDSWVTDATANNNDFALSGSLGTDTSP